MKLSAGFFASSNSYSVSNKISESSLKKQIYTEKNCNATIKQTVKFLVKIQGPVTQRADSFSSGYFNFINMISQLFIDYKYNICAF